jgi:UDP-N-acetylmuramoyl-tripeptide--D-alanyl-D-alanine ligase
LATAGNFNNEIGVPLTLLRLRAKHQHAVVELGMNHPGEIARLAAIARPTIALVNNAQREHQEFMATVEAVALENGAVFAFLPEDGTAVFPTATTFTPLWSDMAHNGASRRCMTFGEPADADISLVRADWQQGAWPVGIRTPLGAFDASLHIAGRHNVVNALAATACALAAGVSLDTIAAGLTAFEPVKGRSKASEVVLAGGHSLTLVDDSYNANPDSVRAPSTCWRHCRARACWCWATWARSATAHLSSTPRWATGRGSAASRPCTLGAETTHSIAAFGGSGNDGRHFQDADALNAAVLARLPQVAACSSRARAS